MLVIVIIERWWKISTGFWNERKQITMDSGTRE